MQEEQVLPLRRSEHAPREARRFVVRTLSGWGRQASISVAEVVASELVTNAVRHATGRIELRLELHDGARVRVSVSDGSPQSRPLRGGSPDERGGFGLNIVDALTTSWGVDVDGDQKCVWADLDLARTP